MTTYNLINVATPLPRPRTPAGRGLCVGCDQYEPLVEYEIMLNDGKVERVVYCQGCAEAASSPEAPQILTCKEVTP